MEHEKRTMSRLLFIYAFLTLFLLWPFHHFPFILISYDFSTLLPIYKTFQKLRLWEILNSYVIYFFHLLLIAKLHIFFFSSSCCDVAFFLSIIGPFMFNRKFRRDGVNKDHYSFCQRSCFFFIFYPRISICLLITFFFFLFDIIFNYLLHCLLLFLALSFSLIPQLNGSSTLFT